MPTLPHPQRMSAWFAGVAVAGLFLMKAAGVDRLILAQTCGLLLVANGLLHLFLLVVADVEEGDATAKRTASAARSIGLVLLGVAQLLRDSWLGVAVIVLAVIANVAPWLVKKSSSIRTSLSR